MSSRWWRKNEGLKKTLFQLGLGQLVSFDLAVMTFIASLVTTQVDAPIALSLSGYLLLAVVHGSVLLYRRHKLLVPWYWYVLLALADVHGNYLVNKAFQFTSITSITILDCWTIAWSIILTWSFLGTKYSLWQFLGAAICVAGLALVLFSDAGVAGGGGGSNPLWGDFLVIASTVCFSGCNAGEEFCAKRKDTIEVIAMIAVFGVLISASEISVLEWKTLQSVEWSGTLLSAYAGYAVAGCLFYTLVPYVLKTSGSTLFNLSLLTFDMWAVAIRIFFYKQKVDGLFYLAFLFVVVGLVIYSKTEKRTNSTTTIHENESFGLEYCLIDEENSEPENSLEDK